MTINHIIQWDSKYTLVQHNNENSELVVSRFNGHLNSQQINIALNYYRKRDKEHKR